MTPTGVAGGLLYLLQTLSLHVLIANQAQIDLATTLKEFNLTKKQSMEQGQSPQLHDWMS